MSHDAHERNAATPSIEVAALKGGVPAAGGDVPFRLRLAPPPLPERADRPRLNLGLVLDRSGSMAGIPLVHAKQAADRAVRMLDPEDHISVVTYDASVDALVPSTPVGDGRHVRRAIATVQAGGTTALHAGWLEGASQVASHLDARALNRVLLLSDGMANVGVTDPDVIATDAASVGETGVSTSTVGLGGQFNEDLLEAMAQAGGGNTYLVESSEGLRAVLEAELRGLSATFGRRVRLAFRMNGSGAQVAEILDDLPIEGEELRLPDLVAGLPQDIAGSLRVPPTEPGEAHLGTVLLRWTVASGEPIELAVPVVLQSLDAASYEAAPVDHAVGALHEELRIARLKDQATFALDRGDRDGALRLITRAQQRLEALPCEMRRPSEVADLESLRMAFDSRDDVLARKRAKAQVYRKRRSFYHERLEVAPDDDGTTRPEPAPPAEAPPGPSLLRTG